MGSSHPLVSIKVKCQSTILSHPSCAHLFCDDMPGIELSVAMCTFNGRRSLGAQLDSIVAQQRLPDELVICDDGSSDGSIEIIRQFAESAPFPTRLVVNAKNLGSTKNFEQAISLFRAQSWLWPIRTMSGTSTSSRGSRMRS